MRIEMAAVSGIWVVDSAVTSRASTRVVKPRPGQQVRLVSGNRRLVLRGFSDGSVEGSASQRAFHWKRTGGDIHRQASLRNEKVDRSEREQNSDHDTEDKFAHGSDRGIAGHRIQDSEMKKSGT